MKQLTGKIILAIALAVLVYIGLTIWSNTSELLAALEGFNILALVFVLALSLGNYTLRFLKWQYYLHVLAIKIPLFDSALVFLAGFAMTITPGKVGEILKSFLLKRSFEIPITRTATIVFADRVTDLIAYLMIAAATATTFQYGYQMLFILAAGVTLLVAIILWRRLAELIFTILGRWNFLAKHVQKLRTVYEHSRKLVQPKQLLVAIILATGAWLLECIALAVIFWGLHHPITLTGAIFSYAFSAIIGAVSMFPGGLGATEASIAVLLTSQNVSSGLSTAATLLVRAGTLWFAVLLGIPALVWTNYRYRQYHLNK